MNFRELQVGSTYVLPIEKKNYSDQLMSFWSKTILDNEREYKTAMTQKQFRGIWRYSKMQLM